MSTFFVSQDENQLHKGYENILQQELFFIRAGKFSSDRFYKLTLEERNYFLHILNEEAEKKYEQAQKAEAEAKKAKSKR